MTGLALPRPGLPGLRVVELGPADAPRLQRLFEATPGYFEIVHGEPAPPGEALSELTEEPPLALPFERRWHIGYAEADGELAAYAGVLGGLIVPEVCHLGLFVVAGTRQGRGEGSAIYQALEDWARGGGAAWMRLGVVQGNTPAERFWARHGFRQSRVREGMPIGARVHTVRAMFKPLAGGTPEQYLARVARDRPEAP